MADSPHSSIEEGMEVDTSTHEEEEQDNLGEELVADPEQQDEDQQNEEQEKAEEVPDDEQIATELIYQMMDRVPSKVAKALGEIHTHLSAGKLFDELVTAADKLVAAIREEDAEFTFAAPTPNQLMNLILLRCEDERVNTRKNAISALEQLFLHLADPAIVDVCVEKLKLRCRDQSLAVRKHAAEAITKLLLKSKVGVESLQNAWLHFVLLLIMDRELAVQQLCSKLFTDVIISPIVHASQGSVWDLLAAVEKEVELRRLFLRCLVFQDKEKVLPSRLIAILDARSGADVPNASSTWMLLADLSSFLKVNPGKAADLWINKLDPDSSSAVIGYVAKIIANRAEALPPHQKTFLKTRIGDALMHHSVNPTHIPTVYYAFARLCDAVGDAATGRAELTRFNKEWYRTTVRELDSTIYDDSDNTENVDPMMGGEDVPDELLNELTGKIVKLVSSIGEAVQYTPSLVDKQVFKLLKVIIASDVLKGLTDDLRSTAAPTPTTMSPTRSIYNPGEGLLARSGLPSERGGTIGTHGGQFVTKVYNRVLRTELMSRRVRAHSVLTLGKLCLQDEKLAKKCIPVFVRQLGINSDHFVRNNIVVVVCDLCIRYTLLVDRYSTLLASCLKDNSVLVRHQALVLLTNLIKEQYLKWEGPIIYRFVTALLDPEKEIRDYAEFCLIDILLGQFPSMFFNHFIECLFYFNDVVHQSWTDSESRDDLDAEVNSKCSLRGADKAESRMTLYKFMIKRFSDEQKLKISAKIASDVFCPLVEGGLNLNDARTQSLLVDSLEVIRCAEMKLQLQLGQKDVNDEGDEEEPPEAVKAAAKKMISKIFRKTIIEAVMPHLVALRQTLIEKRDPQLNLCYTVLLEFYQDHKEQLDDYLASDRQLRTELQFDLARQR